MALLETHDGLLSQCKTENDLNRVHIAFGNTMTPSEVIELEETIFVDSYQVPPLHPGASFTLEQLRALSRTWIETLRDDLKSADKPVVEPFMRRDIRKSVTLYTDGNEPAGKTLLITLCGANHRIMMPIPTFLQNTSAATTDVLFIRDGTRSGYRAGLEGLAPAIEELGAAIPGLLDTSAYRRLVGIGVSAGGLPVLMLALQMNFDAVLVCGGGSPNDPRWNRPGRPSPADTISEAGLEDRKLNITVAYGVDNPADREYAKDIAACIGITAVEVGLADVEVGHNILYPLARRGMLPAFLSQHLGI